MTRDETIKVMAMAMRSSNAWPVVFGARAAETLADAALLSLEDRGLIKLDKSVDEIAALTQGD